MTGEPDSVDDKSVPLPDLSHPTDVPPAYESHGAPLEPVISYGPPPSDEIRSSIASPPGYATALPATFPVGNQDVAPLVSVPEVEAHLRLLGAFWQLREDVIAQPWMNMPAEARWSVFVARSVMRFEKWYLSVIGREERPAVVLMDPELPPLDVAMVWHSYCLNPRIYLEDGLKRTTNLLKLGPFPLGKLSATLDPFSLRSLDPIQARVALFETLTDEPFSVPLVVQESDHTTIKCPSCQVGVDVPWVNTRETGFAQAQFSATCTSCKLVFGKEALGVRRLCDHLVAWLAEPTDHFVAGTVLDPVTGMPNYEKSLVFNKRLFTWFSAVCKGKDAAEIGKLLDWSIVKTEVCCRTGMTMLSQTPTPPRIRRVLGHYRHSGVFSIDLVGATLRQGTFIGKMGEIGWTTPTHLSTERGPLVRAIARFHAWLDLISANPTTFYVPTLDIDLVWHTFMLYSDRYRSMTYKILGRIVDHEDKVEEGTLSDGFDLTARAWKARFGVPYNYCGCAPSTNASKLGSLKDRVLRKEIVPVSSNRPKRQELASMDEAEAGISHPSTHNSIVVLGNAQAQKARAERDADVAKRTEQLRRAAAKGKGDEWDELVAKRNEGHKDAFLATAVAGRAAAYLPYILDGTSLTGGKCAAGLSGGLCTAGGGRGFCGNLGTNAWGGSIATSMNNRS